MSEWWFNAVSATVLLLNLDRTHMETPAECLYAKPYLSSELSLVTALRAVITTTSTYPSFSSCKGQPFRVISPC